MLCDPMPSDDMYPTSRFIPHSTLSLIFFTSLLVSIPTDYSFSQANQTQMRSVSRFHAMQKRDGHRCYAHTVSNETNDRRLARNRHFNLKKLSVKHVPFHSATQPILCHTGFYFAASIFRLCLSVVLYFLVRYATFQLLFNKIMLIFMIKFTAISNQIIQLEFKLSRIESCKFLHRNFNFYKNYYK